MDSKAKYVIVYDFETGGLCSKEKRAFYDIALVELAMVAIDLKTLEVCDTADYIFQRDYKENLIYEQQAIEVHGVTKEIQDANGIPIKDIYKGTKDFFKKYKNPFIGAILAGHNIISYDNPFMRNWFNFMNENDPIDNYVKSYIDTYHWANFAELSQPDYKLMTCCNQNGIDLVGAHRALADTEANAQLLIKYFERLRGKGTITEVQEKVVRFRETFQIDIK